MDVKTLCLGVLTLGDASGYEIRKQFEEGPFAHFFGASYGSIYPALAQLLNDGFVTVTEHPQEGKPDKKIYRLTPQGHDHFADALKSVPAPDKFRSETLVHLFFAELMTPEHLSAVIDAYFEHFRAMSGFMKTLDPAGIPPGRMFVRGIGETFYSTMADFMATNRDRVLADVAEANANAPKSRIPEAAE